jgi:chromosome segregation ATPase
MQKANVLYGVTMRDDGTSALLSINLDEVGTLKNDKKQTVTV